MNATAEFSPAFTESLRARTNAVGHADWDFIELEYDRAGREGQHEYYVILGLRLRPDDGRVDWSIEPMQHLDTRPDVHSSTFTTLTEATHTRLRLYAILRHTILPLLTQHQLRLGCHVASIFP
jgi:hypothetical protein